MKVLIRILGATLVIVANLTLSSCGGGGGGGSVEGPATPPAPQQGAEAPDQNEVEGERSPIVLAAQISSDGLQPLGGPVRLKATGGQLSTNISKYSVYVNDELLPDSALTVDGDMLTVQGPLEASENVIEVFAPDAMDNLIEHKSILWAGQSQLTGRVVDSSGAPVPNAQVIATLGDDETVKAQTVTNANGNYTFSNFPDRTVLISVISPNGIPGTSSGVGGTAIPDVVLVPFGTPVATANNDFNSGATGWVNQNGAVITIEDHIENVGPTNSASITQALLSIINRYLPFSSAYAQAAPNKDMKVTTSGPGSRTVTYTFTPPPNAKSVQLRYRFVTAEFPDFVGSQFNDSFSLKLRTASGAHTAATGTLNGLGASAFDASKSTAWKDISLSLPAPGEPIQVDLTVANVGDGILDSSLYVDVVTLSEVAIENAQLFDLKTPAVPLQLPTATRPGIPAQPEEPGAALKMLSVGQHEYFNGKTPVQATFRLTGPAGVRITGLELQVFQGGTTPKARGPLVSTLGPSILKAFDDSGVIELKNQVVAFEIPSSELATIARAKDGKVTLKLEVRADGQQPVIKELGSARILDYWTGANRYGGPPTPDNAEEGGDDWVLPSSRDVFKVINATFGDFSNMHGGKLRPHSSHTEGVDVDGWFNGYNARNANTAQTIIDMINREGAQKKVKLVLVTFEEKDGNVFYDAIKNVELTDKRPAIKVIRPYRGHGGHFHMRAEGRP